MSKNKKNGLIPNKNAILLFKFGINKYIQGFYDGNAYFSCAGRYVEIAEETGNNEQGDKHEGVFARLKSHDSRIKEAQDTYGSDLQILEDGDHVLLRRKSTLYYPLFCLYAYKASDALRVAEPKAGYQTITYKFDDKIFEGFSKSISVAKLLDMPNIVACTTFKARPFIERMKGTLVYNNYDFKSDYIDYKVKSKEEYWIEPTYDREELFFKEPQYSYQNEARFCIINDKFTRFDQHIDLRFGKIADSDRAIVLGHEFYFNQKIELGGIPE